MGRFKGQFFIIGALFISILLFMGMQPMIGVSKTRTEDMNRFSENLESELIHALNIGLNGTQPLGALYNFTEFSLDGAKNRGMELSSFWVVFMEDGSGMNVSIGNFMGSAKNFVLNVSGDEKNIDTANGSVNSSVFSVSGYKFNATVTVDSETSEMTLLRDKTSIYLAMSLEREGNVVKKEILA